MKKLPEEKILAEEVREFGMTAVGRKYGVSRNAVYMSLSRARSIDRSEVIEASKQVKVEPLPIQTECGFPRVQRKVNGCLVSLRFLSFLDGGPDFKSAANNTELF